MKYVAVLSYVLCFVVLAFAAAAVIGVVVDARPAIAQCAMCGEAVESASEADGGSLARGYRWVPDWSLSLRVPCGPTTSRTWSRRVMPMRLAVFRGKAPFSADLGACLTLPMFLARSSGATIPA